ncbi:MAG: GGDEF domain-containing protein [Burkholderiaceae bacterium]|nr:GGDEF domain-containing protein [Roseateles sp.]MBV8470052.1 GGDEF domain-containing protein [Burkholderiaceae bacterium]
MPSLPPPARRTSPTARSVIGLILLLLLILIGHSAWRVHGLKLDATTHAAFELQLLAIFVLVLLAAWLTEHWLLRDLRRITSDMERFDTSSGFSSTQTGDDAKPRHAPAEVQQIERALSQLQSQMAQQLQQDQARVNALESEVKRQAAALAASEQILEMQRGELARLSRHDKLTGLINRLEFDERMRREFKRCQRSRNDLALAVLDLDHMRGYNEAMGRDAGNALLRQFCELMEQHFKRDTDLLARLDDNAFAALLPSMDAALAQSRLDALREEWRDLQQPGGPDANPPVVTLSIGLAVMTPRDPYLGATALLQAAEEALYFAKHTGRDRLSRAPEARHQEGLTRGREPVLPTTAR